MKIRTVSRLKRKFDRGGLYLNYLSIIVTGGTFLKVFGLDSWYHYFAGAVVVVLFRFIAGHLDDRFGILSNEQDQLTRKNPEWQDMAKKIDELYKKSK
jgi:hypothetical protein